MNRIDDRYRMKTTPACSPEAVVQGEGWRITVLTPALIRLEVSDGGRFEDHATQTVVSRSFPVPSFSAVPDGEGVTLKTDRLTLLYTGGPLTPNSLAVRMPALGRDWHWGDNQRVLPATARTLDQVNGSCELGKSVLSRDSIAVLDDSGSLILAEDGWVDSRSHGETDVYLFAYLTDYMGALRDYCRLTGEIPMLPRFALGNWWSRYHRYTQEEYTRLMDRFQEEDLPFSVAVIDMDWHNVRIDPKYGTGWTGWTWNKELFPDHKALLKDLHDRGMQVTLNVHPAEGFSAHEDCYPEMARRSGVDPATEQNIPFDVTDPKLLENYFDAVLKPMEEEGVSFWWMDWQQGSATSIPGLDPLWIVNHYHFMNSGRDGKRPMIFSRYAGHGSQRYPVGFSGDTWMTWESLDFQPYFTSMASNVAYSWWSHDIGGHMLGERDDEMTARWVQYGVFSPINRLHSTENDFMSKEPWNYSRDTRAVMNRFLRLRHRLIPYLYTMNERTHSLCDPLVCPMYFRHPDDNRAYRQKNEYYFGTELLVSPITTPADRESARGRVRTWLPEGLWFDVFTGLCYDGDREIVNSRSLDDMPVFAKAGAIIPLSEDPVSPRTDNPESLRLEVFPGADGAFTLYEDDGCTTGYERGEAVTTDYTWHWGENSAEFTIAAPQGHTELIPGSRRYAVAFRCTEAARVTAPVSCEVSREGDAILVSLPAVKGPVTIRLEDCSVRKNDTEQKLFDILLHAQWDNMGKGKVMNLIRKTESLPRLISILNGMDIPDGIRDALYEVLLARC